MNRLLLLLVLGTFLAICQMALSNGVPGATRLQGKPDVAIAYSVGEKVEGKTQGEWSAEWWKWALTIKKDRNPLLDKTGEFAAEGQNGPVWFIAGNLGGTMKRKCSVPAGRPLLIPVFNNFASQPSKDRTASETQKLVAEMTAEAKEWIDRHDGMECVIDGKAIADLSKRRFVSPLFETKAPRAPEAIHPSVAGNQTGISDGYWVMLRPLSPGNHTMRIKSKLKEKKGEDPFAMDITYEFTVEAKK